MIGTVRTEPLPERDVLSGAERQRRYRQRGGERGAARKYRRSKSKWTTDAAYLSRPFIAWDGEGVTDPITGEHRYTLLAVRGDGIDESISNRDGIPTAHALELILDVHARARKDAIHIVYGGSYDFNMILRDLDRDELDCLYHAGSLKWRGYRLRWRPGKSFYVARAARNGQRTKGATIYDVVSFFQCSFVQACDDYLGANFAHRDVIVASKAKRGSFADADADAVAEYNSYELDNLIDLMTELRARLNKVTLRPRRWDGPGAVAAALLLREGVKDAIAPTPAPVAQAARYAYAGGRFEVIQFGYLDRTVWEYDVNSAYPHALLNVPNLADGWWEHVPDDPGNRDFALYHVEYEGFDPAIPGALWNRAENGTICYPMSTIGWYWTPEVAVARDYCARGHGTMRVTEAWVYHPGPAPKPFAFIEPLYRQRQALKAAGDGAHTGIKLGLNSLYGKTAQQVGARLVNGEWRLPPFHCLEWAGYVTAHCRAAVLNAVLDNLGDVIAFETDAVFTTSPLPVLIGSGLGEFEETVFDDLLYCQSGLYFGTSKGKAIAKTRGVDRGSVTRDDVLSALAQPLAAERVVNARLTRFIGAGVALAQNFDRWRRWEVVSKTLTLEPTGKRVHLCDCMTLSDDRRQAFPLGRLHQTVCPWSPGHSHEYPVAWVNPNPNMSELEELRWEEKTYE